MTLNGSNTMTIYEELLEEASNNGLVVREKALSSSDGLIYKNRIAISDRLETSAEKACVLAEEIGHYHTAVGDIVDLQDIENLKQEKKGRLHGYNRLIGLRGIISAFLYSSGYCSLSESLSLWYIPVGSAYRCLI